MSGLQPVNRDELQENSSQYLTFILADEEYALDILRVQEIRGWQAPTVMPNMPDFILGVINLRGNVIPIIDLRKRFKLAAIEFNSNTVVIVVKVMHSKGERTIGIVVDAVSDVYNIAEPDVRPAPDFGGVVGTEYVKGIATVNDRMVILLELDSLINVGVLQDVAVK